MDSFEVVGSEYISHIIFRVDFECYHKHDI